jgi:hypothetical protein
MTQLEQQLNAASQYIHQPVNQLYLKRLCRILISSNNTQQEMHNHHIIPKSWGGDNSHCNMIKVTPRHHFVIHKMMCKAFPQDKKMQHAFKLMIQTTGKSKQYERFLTTFFSDIRDLFHDGIMVSNRRNHVMSKHKVTGEVQLVPKSVFDNEDVWIGISSGVARSARHRKKISEAQLGRPRTLTQISSAVRVNKALKEQRVTCLCCKKVFDLGNFAKHDRNIATRGWSLTDDRKAKMLSGKKKIDGERGTLRGLYIIKVDGIKYLCYNLWKFFEEQGVSPPTGRKKYCSEKIGTHRNKETITISDVLLLSSLPVID